MLSIVYSSAAAHPFADDELAALLATSRANNERTDITGMLLYRDGRFLQVLEGPDEAVRERMAVITEDPRHARIAVLLEDPVDERMFPDWTMGYALVTDAMAAQLPGYRTSFEDLGGSSDEDDARDDGGAGGGIGPALAQLARWYHERR